MDEIRELLRGAYDLHVHSAPDLLPRRMDDIEMAERIRAAGMGGYAIKSHFFCTSERAELIRKMVPECDAVGTITLNRSVGGVNPCAVEMAARSGAKLVWFPTCDSEHERAHVFNGDPNKKLPYWAQILTDLQHDGIEVPPIRILRDGKLLPEVIEVLDIMARHDMILATSHISHEEAFALVKEACARKVQRIIVTHVDFPTTFYTVEEQRELVRFGAYMEHCYTTFATGKVDFDVTMEQIRAIGSEHVILATDLGQKTAVYPDEGMMVFASRLRENGWKDQQIRRMAVDNPRRLLNK